MADKAKDLKKGVQSRAPAFPSHFGSHASMVNEAETKKLNNPDQVVCKDEFGLYVTDRWRLDCGMADPNRFHGDRLSLKAAAANE